MWSILDTKDVEYVISPDQAVVVDSCGPRHSPEKTPSSRRSPAAAQAATSTTTSTARVKHHPTTIRKASAQISQLEGSHWRCHRTCRTWRCRTWRCRADHTRCREVLALAVGVSGCALNSDNPRTVDPHP